MEWNAAMYLVVFIYGTFSSVIFTITESFPQILLVSFMWVGSILSLCLAISIQYEANEANYDEINSELNENW